MEKSHVGMGYTFCPMCGAEHDEVVLLDTRLRNTLERRQQVGVGLCKPCDEKTGEYVGLVEVSGGARLTGQTAWVRRRVWSHLFNTDVPPKWARVEVGIIDALKTKVPE